MERTRFVFEGLVEIEARIRRLAAEVGYLTVSDRTERSHEEPLGRFDFTTKDALPYLETTEDTDTETASEWLEAGEAQEEEEPSDTEGEPTDVSALAEAGCRWLRDIARRNTVGEPYRRLRVRIYTLKGARVLDTAGFVCKNIDHDIDLPVPSDTQILPNPNELRIPTPTFEEGAMVGVARAMKVLGDSYAHWGQIMLGSVGQLQGINNTMLAHLHRDLESSRGQVDQLLGTILDARVAALQASDESQALERRDDQRAELAKQAMLQLGEVAKVLLVAKDVPAELGAAFGAIQRNPSLLGALSEPDVQRLLEEPQNLEMLAGLLRQFAQQARAARETQVTQTQAL